VASDGFRPIASLPGHVGRVTGPILTTSGRCVCLCLQVENETWDTIGAPTPLLRVHLCVPVQNHDVAALEQKELDGQAAVTGGTKLRPPLAVLDLLSLSCGRGFPPAMSFMSRDVGI